MAQNQQKRWFHGWNCHSQLLRRPVTPKIFSHYLVGVPLSFILASTERYGGFSEWSRSQKKIKNVQFLSINHYKLFKAATWSDKSGWADCMTKCLLPGLHIESIWTVKGFSGECFSHLWTFLCTLDCSEGPPYHSVLAKIKLRGIRRENVKTFDSIGYISSCEWLFQAWNWRFLGFWVTLGPPGSP